ncbi:hypothetical protein B0O80DRAFT_446726 [Mortierella sp. GBAus27b]|nr:hypothetical protein B0O80DRAFT_446726 [Mortierella sp. GBAus27b]
MSDAQGNPEPDRTGTPDPDRAGTPEPGGMARAAASPDNDAARVREHHQRVHDRFRQNQHQADYAQTSTHPHDPVPNQGTQPYYASSHDLGVSPLFTAKSQYRLSDFTLLETLGKEYTHNHDHDEPCRV